MIYIYDLQTYTKTLSYSIKPRKSNRYRTKCKT